MNDGDDSSSVSVLTSSTVEENQDDMGDDDDELLGGVGVGIGVDVFEFGDDGVNALNISLDSLDTDFPRLVSVLLIFVGFGVSGEFDSEVMEDNDFGMNDDNREV
jgi:hypothetical protein